MKKLNLFFRLAGVALAAMAVISCGKNPDYRNAVPSNAFLVCTVDNQSLMKKAAGDAGANPLYRMLTEKLGQESGLTAENKDYILSLMKNPQESGLDQTRPGYIFCAMAGATPYEGMDAGVVSPMGDKAKFSRLAEFIASKDEDSQIKKEGGLDVVVFGNSANTTSLCAYDETTCLFFFSQKDYATTLARVQELMSQKQDKSLFADKAVAEQLSKTNDINFYLSYASLPQAMFGQLGASPIIQAVQNLSVTASVNFEKGKIVCDGAPLFKNKEDKEKFLKLYDYSKPQTGKLLEYIPEGSIAVMGTNLNGAKLYEMLISVPGYGAMAAIPTVKQVFDAIDGDVDLAFTWLNNESYNRWIPTGALLATVNNPAILETLMAEMGPLPIAKTGNKQYQLTLDDIAINFGVKDDMFYITNDQTVLSAINGKKIESMKASKNLFVKQNSTMTLDFKGLILILHQIMGEAPSEEAQAALEALGIFSTMEAKGTTEGGSMVVTMTDTGRNALATICAAIAGIVEKADR